MTKYSEFINQYGLSKTLRFRLIPQGKTEDFLKINNVIESDNELAQNYVLMKPV